MKCAHCGTPKATYTWNLQACADKRKKRKKKLCLRCDVELNRIVLEFFNDPRVDEKLATYEISRS